MSFRQRVRDVLGRGIEVPLGEGLPLRPSLGKKRRSSGRGRAKRGYFGRYPAGSPELKELVQRAQRSRRASLEGHYKQLSDLSSERTRTLLARRAAAIRSMKNRKQRRGMIRSWFGGAELHPYGGGGLGLFDHGIPTAAEFKQKRLSPSVAIGAVSQRIPIRSAAGCHQAIRLAKLASRGMLKTRQGGVTRKVRLNPFKAVRGELSPRQVAAVARMMAANAARNPNYGPKAQEWARRAGILGYAGGRRRAESELLEPGEGVF